MHECPPALAGGAGPAELARRALAPVPTPRLRTCVRHRSASLGTLLGVDDPVTERVFELSELLVHQLGVEDVGATFPHSVAYHPTCH